MKKQYCKFDGSCLMTPVPYYYVLDRMYDVWLLVDRAGAIVERYAYDEYGRPLTCPLRPGAAGMSRGRESAGRGDMDNDTDLDSTDLARVLDAAGYGASYVWDPRADLDDDGDCDITDYTLCQTKDDNWPPAGSPTVAQAFSDVGNPFGFQGRVHFALDTAAEATDGKLMLVDHRRRMNDPITGRWTTRDPLFNNLTLVSSPFGTPFSALRYATGRIQDGWSHYEAFGSCPLSLRDPSGMNPPPAAGCNAATEGTVAGFGWEWTSTGACLCFKCKQSGTGQGITTSFVSGTETCQMTWICDCFFGGWCEWEEFELSCTCSCPPGYVPFW